MKMLKRSGELFDRALDLFSGLAGFMLVFSTFGVGVAIITRYFFNRPISWITEISEFILLYVTFLVAASVLRDEGHVKMDLIMDYLSPKMQSAINIVTSILCAVVCLILSWFGVKVTWELFLSKSFTYTILELPKFIFTFIICFGFFLLLIQFIRRTVGYFQEFGKPQD